MAKTIFSNKKAYHDYTVVEKIEAGIVLEGWEVKSLKNNMGDFRSAFAIIDAKNNISLRNMNISKWKTGEQKSDVETKRERRLLMNKKEIAKLSGLAARPGYTMIPLEIYINDKGLVKVQMAVVKGKKQYEKKQVVKDRDMVRRMRQEMNDR